MKRFLLISGILFFVWACSTQKSVLKVEPKAEEEVQEQDSVEYSMETFDAKFKSWYERHKSPAMYRTQDYYEYWNRQYVLAWNAHAMDARRNSFFEPIVGYDQNTDYGLELNHELFYYFQYVEHVLKIPILPGGGPKLINFHP